MESKGGHKLNKFKQADNMDVDELTNKLERIKAAEMETEVCMYSHEIEKRIKVLDFGDDRRMSEDNIFKNMLNENYIGGDSVNREEGLSKFQA